LDVHEILVPFGDWIEYLLRTDSAWGLSVDLCSAAVRFPLKGTAGMIGYENERFAPPED